MLLHGWLAAERSALRQNYTNAKLSKIDGKCFRRSFKTQGAISEECFVFVHGWLLNVQQSQERKKEERTRLDP